jgi:nitrile hydratase subunit beta
MRAYHDLGGTPAGPIDKEEHELQLWEKRIEALLVLMNRKKILRVDENRRGLESLGNETYFSLSYAERRMLSMSNNLLFKGVITVEELAAKIAEIESREDPLP